MFSENHHLALLSGPSIGGPYEFVSELAPHLRMDLKRLADGSLLLLSEGQAENSDPAFQGYGFKFMHFAAGSVLGTWAEYLVYSLGREWDGDAGGND